ncbi:gamma-glutamylpolyamine synthetase GlnA3 [Fodinicola feengrottensis]|uniref:Gamma-glutamylpolyamine synthetase GlnA3 n=1 Tax=Fodinicola feengrottensis TaxID=435914 RepID=A0ABN2G3N3_9ACTN
MSEAAIKRLRDQGLRLLATTFVCNAGVVRTKAVPAGRLESLAANGVGMSPVMAVMAVDGGITSGGGYGGPVGDMRLFPDWDAAVVLDPVTGLGWAPVDQLSQELEPMSCCSRSALRRVAQAATADYQMAFEIEFTVFDGGVVAHHGPAYGAVPLFELDELCVDIVEALDRVGVAVDQIHPEYGPGQLELSVAPAAPIAAVDRYVLTRLVIRRVAQEHGLTVSYAPLTVPDSVGNGAHLHFSPWRDGKNLFGGGTGQHGLTVDGEHLIAGVVEGLAEAIALLASGALSYERLLPSRWAAPWATWGLENRESAVRLVQGTKTARPNSANAEVKVVDGAANPYLAAAAVIALAERGLAQKTPLPEPVTADPASLSDAERTQRGIRRLPADLGTALDALQFSSFFSETLSPDLLGSFVAVRRYEHETYGGQPVADRIRALRWSY